MFLGVSLSCCLGWLVHDSVKGVSFRATFVRLHSERLELHKALKLIFYESWKMGEIVYSNSRLQRAIYFTKMLPKQYYSLCPNFFNTDIN